MIASMWIGNLMLDHQPPAHRHVGSASQSAVSLSLSRHPAVLRHRRLHREQQRGGSLAGGAAAWPAMSPASVVRPDDPGLCSGR
jgi:hypothetical protein